MATKKASTPTINSIKDFGALAAKMIAGRSAAVPAPPSAPQAPAAPAPATAAAPAQAAQFSPRVDPFLTPENLSYLAEWMRTAGDNRDQWISSLGTARADTQYASDGLQKQATSAKTQTADNLQARGLFQSSLKDAAINDIEAERTRQQGDLDRKLGAVTNDYNTYVAKYGGQLADSTGAINGAKVNGIIDPNGPNNQPLGSEVATFWQNLLATKAQNAANVNAQLSANDAQANASAPALPAAPSGGVSTPGIAAVKPVTLKTPTSVGGAAASALAKLTGQTANYVSGSTTASGGPKLKLKKITA